jgi:hypothetical protein
MKGRLRVDARSPQGCEWNASAASSEEAPPLRAGLRGGALAGRHLASRTVAARTWAMRRVTPSTYGSFIPMRQSAAFEAGRGAFP